MKKWICFFIKILISYCFVYAIDYYFVQDDLLTYRTIFNIPILIASYWLLKKKTHDVHLQRVSYVTGIIYAVVFILGKEINDTNTTIALWMSLRNIVSTLTRFLGLSCVIAKLAEILFEKYIAFIEKDKLSLHENKTVLFNSFGIYLITWLVFFMSWLPCYLAFYPGTFDYDGPAQALMAVQGIGKYTTHHPPLHTLIFEGCMRFGSYCGVEPIIIYSLIQMIMLSGVLAYVVLFLVNNYCNNYKEVIIIYLFYSINPVVALFSFIMTKDIPFAMVFILLNIQIVKLLNRTDNDIIDLFTTGIITLLNMLFRNNAYYIIIVLAVVFLFLNIKRKEKIKIVIMFALAIMIFKMITIYVYDAVGIEDNDSFIETIAVPMQQIALVIKEDKDSITNEEFNRIEKFIDTEVLIERYNPRFYDPIKGAIKKTYLDNHVFEYIKLWAELGIDYPEKYTRAFLMLNLPYWYPDAATNDIYSNRRYIETDIVPNDAYCFERDSKLPGLLSAYEKVAEYSCFKDMPIVINLFSITTPIWVLINGVILIFVKKNHRELLYFTPAILLWGTYMFGPVSNFRYMLPIFLMYPFYILIVFNEKEKTIV